MNDSDQKPKDDQVLDAEIVETPANENPVSDEPNSQVSTLLEIEKAIRLRISALERFKEEIKPLREMLESTLEADLEYAEISAAAKDVAKKKSAKKKELLNTSAGKEITQKLKALQDTVKEHKESLSYFLQEYSRLTGAKEIEGEDGELRQIVYVAKLVRKTKLERE